MDPIFFRCVNERVKMELVYMSQTGEISQRCVSPISCDGNRLTAYCLNKKQVRTFNVQQILSVAYRLPLS